ncbi:hypothetical protein K435DRAFT_818072 [Dendrothele bispora CBS 962.96]|uniref:Uncharacterized protein n=1 Tax=Dendrothele bispora (strain CBS 962.96) TaxID=1314807 RepID=A0A4S8MFE5_DENBC|nr:hypothetical protein K435DRAFT_818072 [Dendrothele bispora CBS 962.96]
MNLPPDIRYLPENVFIVGITPGPNLPDVITISHILRPLIDTLITHWNGIIIQTHLHPAGTLIRVAVLPFIADLQAIRKITGFLGHSANLFCSWCICPNSDKELEVREQTTRWQEQTTITARNRLATQNGVRWTPLHDLPYFDAVWHVVLGFMHNTLEGVLEDHLRQRWGIDKHEGGGKAKEDDSEAEEEYEVEDSSVELDSELDGLRRESEESGNEGNPILPFRLRSQRSSASSPLPSQSQEDVEIALDAIPSPFHLPSDEEARTEVPASATPRPEDFEDEDEDDDPSYQEDEDLLFDFKPEWLESIRKCIQDVALPTHAHRPPGNLGEPSHGKLKAKEYLDLFTIFLPLILPEIWSTDRATDYERALLSNFYHLVASTNIIAAYSTSDSEADAYVYHYTEYRKTRAEIYAGVASKPNHHYAMHNGQLLKFWGPLSLLNDMDFTMLRQMCRVGRYNALASDGHFQSAEMKALSHLLSTNKLKSLMDTNFQSVTAEEIAKLRRKSQTISETDYDLLFQYLYQHTGLPWRHIHRLPHPPKALVLPITVPTLTHFQHRGHKYSTEQAHDGNSAIQFYDYDPHHRTIYTGSVVRIWQIALEHQGRKQLRIFILVAVDNCLPSTRRDIWYQQGNQDCMSVAK